MPELKEAPAGADVIASRIRQFAEDITQQKAGLTMFDPNNPSQYRIIGITEVIKDLTNALNRHGVCKEFRLVTLARCTHSIALMLPGLGEEYKPQDSTDVVQELRATIHALQN